MIEKKKGEGERIMKPLNAYFVGMTSQALITAALFVLGVISAGQQMITGIIFLAVAFIVPSRPSRTNNEPSS